MSQPSDDKLDASIASDESVLAQATQEDGSTRDLQKNRSSKRFGGSVLTLNKRIRLRIYKAPVDRRFNPREIARLRAVAKVCAKSIPLHEVLLASYDRGEWSLTRGLQGWRAENKFYAAGGKTPTKPLRLPSDPYLTRVCIAERPSMLDGLELTGIGNKEKTRCVSRQCDVKGGRLFKPICPQCMAKKQNRRKPPASETHIAGNAPENSNESEVQQ
jgi:hypothetical protein